MKFYSDEGEEITEIKGIDFGDQKIELPEEIANVLISYRESIKKTAEEEKESLKAEHATLLKEKEDALKKYETTEKSKNELELAKNGELEALKESISAEFQEKIKNVETERNQLKDKMLDSEIKSQISSFENVNPDAIDDIFLKLKMQSPEFSEDGKITIADKELSEAVKEVVESKDHYRVVSTPAGTGPSSSPAAPAHEEEGESDPYTLARRGLAAAE